MGKYRAQMSLPNHLFGTIREYDDDDPVVQHRVSSGMLVPIDKPKPKAKRPATRPVVARHPFGVADDGTDPGAEPVTPKAKQPRKRKATVKPEPEPQPEVESSDAPSDARPAEGSSVQTSWRISD